MKQSKPLTEDILQSQIFKWYNNNYCLKHHNPRHVIFSVPNGAYVSKREAIKLKATGLVSGVSDLIIIQPNRCIFVELKLKKGRQSNTQKEFEKKDNEKKTYELAKKLNIEFPGDKTIEDILEKTKPKETSLFEGPKETEPKAEKVEHEVKRTMSDEAINAIEQDWYSKLNR